MLRTDIEYIVHCDETGQVIGPLSKVHAHLPGVRETLTHYATRSMVYNPTLQKYGLQLKNPKKYGNSSLTGRRDMGVAGHNCYIQDEKGWRYTDFEENMQKEAEEEIGLHVEMATNKQDFVAQTRSFSSEALGFVFDTFLYTQTGNSERVGFVFVITQRTAFDFPDGEVVDFAWFSPSELQSEIQKKPDIFSYSMPMILEKAEKFRKENGL